MIRVCSTRFMFGNHVAYVVEPKHLMPLCVPLRCVRVSDQNILAKNTIFSLIANYCKKSLYLCMHACIYPRYIQ